MNTMSKIIVFEKYPDDLLLLAILKYASDGHFTSDTQIWLVRSTFLQILAPTLIKLTFLWFSNDPEDID